MANVLILAGAHDESHGFPKQRVIAIRHALRHHDSTVVTTHTQSKKHHNPLNPEYSERLNEAVKKTDAVVTAGPFHPLLALPLLPKNLPVWVDIPSDPLADHHILWSQSPTEQNIKSQAVAKMALQNAISRGDVFGLISPELRISFLGQLLLSGRRLSRPDALCHITPITRPTSQPLPPSLRKPREQFDLLLCGSANSWLDTKSIISGLTIAMEQISNLNVHISGRALSNYSEGWEQLQHFSNSMERVHCHDWLDDVEFLDLIKKCHAGIWLDKPSIEPLLGCRTRGILMLHHRRLIIASCSNAWHRHLNEIGVLRAANSINGFVEAIEEEWIKPSPISDVLGSDRDPDTVFKPMLRWLEAPLKTHHELDDSLNLEHQQLIQTHQALLNSRSIRGLNTLHRRLQAFIKPSNTSVE